MCSKPQATPHRRGTGWPHAEHPTRCQRCCLGCPCSTSLFHVPPLLPAQPRWSQEEDGYFGEAEFTPLGPTGPFITFCERLRVAVCYLSSSTGWISLLLQTILWQMLGCFSYLEQSSTPAHTRHQAWKQPEHPTKPITAIWPPQHTALCCHRKVFHNKVPSIITSPQEHVMAHCIYIHSNIFCQHRRKIKQLCLLIGLLTVPPRVLQQGRAEESLPGLMPSAINSSGYLLSHRNRL